ncbi:MAG: energy-coupling factor transporter transmembrane component T [Nitrososphaeria archaeon]
MVNFDPRTKVVFFTLAFVLAFLSTEIIELILLSSVVLVLSIFSVERDKIFGRLKIMAPVFIVAFILWTFLNQYSIFHVHDGGVNIMVGAFMALRLFLIVVLSLAFVSFVTPVELVNALSSFKLPYKLVFTLGLSLRHISTISDEYIAIKEGQSSRGLELDKGFLIKRIRNYISVVMPLLIRSIENAEKLVLAMELKSFSLNNRRRYSVGKLNNLDYVVIFSMVIVLFIFVVKNFLR